MADMVQYAQAATIYFPIFVAGGTQFAAGTDWTPGGSCAVVQANGTIQFAAGTVTYIGSNFWALPLTEAETQTSQTMIMIREPGTVDDQCAVVQTYGSTGPSAHPNFGLATMPVVGTVAQVITGTIGLAGSLGYMRAGKVTAGTLENMLAGTVTAGTIQNMLAGTITAGTIENMLAGTVTAGTLENMLSGTIVAGTVENMLAGTVTAGTIQNMLAGTVTAGTLQNILSGTIGLAGSLQYMRAGKVTAGTIDNMLAGTVTAGTIDNMLAGTVTSGSINLGTDAVNSIWNAGTKQQFQMVTSPVYDINNDRFTISAWLERDDAVATVSSATLALYSDSGVEVYGNADWDTGPSKIAALNTWIVEKNVATNIKGGTSYMIKTDFDFDGTSFSRLFAFGAFGTGTGA